MRIDACSFGEIIIDGKRHTTDVIIFPDRVKSNWWRKKGHELNPEDIEEIIEEKPDLLIVGTGSSGLMEVKPETKKLLESRGIDFIAKPTSEAYKEYNQRKELGKVIAALHLTC